MENNLSNMIYIYLFVGFIAWFINIPFGFIRQRHPKFSTPWFFWIHASIPVLIYLRIKLGISPWFIPVSITLAIYGQILGAKLCRQNMSEEENLKLNQIPDLLLPQKNLTIKDDEVLVTLLNMGGPKTNNDVKDFQKRLFNDDLLIRFPLSSLLQGFFANILIFFRLKDVKQRYHEIGGGSPIYRSTGAQIKALQKELKKRGRKIRVTYSFNYSPPLPDSTVKQAKLNNKKYLLPLSLYPHYSSATTGSNIHYLNKSAEKIYPQLKILPPPTYYLHPGYIQAFVEKIEEAIKPGETLEDFYILFSAHGLPLYFLVEGDPYPFQIAQTVGLILSRLNRNDRWTLAYQSAVGPLQWLKPSTEEMLHVLAKRGIKKLLIVPVSFVGDHIETIMEIDIEYRQIAEKLGITDYRMSKAIEAHPRFIQALADVVERAVA